MANKEVKQTFYYAEGGLDQVCSLVSGKVKEVFIQAKDATLQTLKDEVLNSDGTVKEAYLTNEEINMDAIINLKNSIFENEFISLFNDPETIFVDYLELQDNYTRVGNQSYDIQVDVKRRKYNGFCI